MYVCRILNRFSMRHYNMTYSLRTTVPYDFPFFAVKIISKVSIIFIVIREFLKHKSVELMYSHS